MRISSFVPQIWLSCLGICAVPDGFEKTPLKSEWILEDTSSQFYVHLCPETHSVARGFCFHAVGYRPAQSPSNSFWQHSGHAAARAADPSRPRPAVLGTRQPRACADGAQGCSALLLPLSTSDGLCGCAFG